MKKKDIELHNQRLDELVIDRLVKTQKWIMEQDWTDGYCPRFEVPRFVSKKYRKQFHPAQDVREVVKEEAALYMIAEKRRREAE